MHLVLLTMSELSYIQATPCLGLNDASNLTISLSCPTHPYALVAQPPPTPPPPLFAYYLAVGKK